MTTLALLTQSTWDLLYGVGGFERPWEDTASGTISTAATDLSSLISANGNWFETDMMEFPSGELVTVVADTASTVNRARDGTTAEALTSTNVIIKDPPFPRGRVEDKIREVIRGDLWPWVWTWFQGTFTFVVGDHMYDLATYIEEVVLVYQENLNADERWHPLSNGWWDVERQVDSTVATNQNMLRVKQVHDLDETVYYTAKRRPHIDDASNISDEIADMIPYAAAAKLAAGRNLQQKQHRTSERRGKEFQADYEGLMSEFLRMRGSLERRLRDEVRVEPRFVQKRRRRW